MIESIKKEWSSLELYSISSAMRQELIGNIVSCGGCWCCFFLLVVVRLERPILRRTYVRRTGSSRWNKNIFKQIGMLPLSTYLELRGSRWLEKIVNMYGYRIPRKLFCVHPNKASDIRACICWNYWDMILANLKFGWTAQETEKLGRRKSKTFLIFQKVCTYCRHNRKKQFTSFDNNSIL